jgi:DNA-binding transcriptional LysR family regulator
MRDRLSGIVAFVQAADAGGFALAAQRLSLSRSAVAKSIARLEQRLGVRLFQRTTRNQTLTEDGQAFYERCVRALAEIEAAEGLLASGKRAPIGRLRVCLPLLLGRYCAAPTLLEVARKYPQLQLELSFTDRIVGSGASRGNVAMGRLFMFHADYLCQCPRPFILSRAAAAAATSS